MLLTDLQLEQQCYYLEVVSADAHHPGGRHGVAAGSTFYIWLGLANMSPTSAEAVMAR